MESLGRPYNLDRKSFFAAAAVVHLLERDKQVGAGRKKQPLLPSRLQDGEKRELWLKTTVRFCDSISLERTVQAGMYRERG
jgi:hypothetical protein